MYPNTFVLKRVHLLKCTDFVTSYYCLLEVAYAALSQADGVNFSSANSLQKANRALSTPTVYNPQKNWCALIIEEKAILNPEIGSKI